MKIKFDGLPNARPSSFATIAEGKYDAQIQDAKMVVSNNTGTEYLAVTFITKDKETVVENYFEPTKPFLQWKLARLIKACNIDLEGEGELKDLIKLIKGKKVTIEVMINDKGYSGLDYSDDKEGVYPRSEETPVTQDTAVQEAIDSNDDDF